MGTSASHAGPGSGISFDPPWLDDIELPGTEDTDDATDQKNTEKAGGTVEWIAPPRRFQSARSELNRYYRTGNKENLTRALGHYSKTGMGGAKNVASRMRLSSAFAAHLLSSLSNNISNNDPLRNLISDLHQNAAGATATISAIVKSICPQGGSLDEVSISVSTAHALSDLYESNVDIDIGHLSEDEIWELASSFLSYEASNRIQLDIGRGIESVDISVSERLSRQNDMSDFLRAEIVAQINKIRNEPGSKTTSYLNDIMHNAIELTFKVFEVTA